MLPLFLSAVLRVRSTDRNEVSSEKPHKVVKLHQDAAFTVEKNAEKEHNSRPCKRVLSVLNVFRRAMSGNGGKTFMKISPCGG